MKHNIIHNYANDKYLLKKFHEIMGEVFPSVSFREFEEKGYWSERYHPYSILKDGKIISNVCVSDMDIIYSGKKYKAAQLGAVATLPEYRNKGLSRILMEHVITEYKDKTDFIFLFANETVMEFYPKFGFVNKPEFLFVHHTNLRSEYSVRKLDLNNPKDDSLLQNMLNNRLPLCTNFGAENYRFITMWYVLNFYKDSLYYFEEENVIVIKNEADGIVKIIDVVFTEIPDWNSLLPKVIEGENTEAIKYYFSPEVLNYKFSKVLPDETGLFILGNLPQTLEPIRLPLTAVT